jgi:glycyl-tRNA synthetase alpha subunit
VANSFAAAVNIKVWVNYKECCQLTYASQVSALHFFVAVYEVYL